MFKVMGYISVIVLEKLVVMLLIALGGYIFAKIFKVSDVEQKFLSKLLIYFVNPFLVFNSLITSEFSINKLKNLVIVLFISLIIYALMIVLSFVAIRKSKKENPEEREIEEGYNTIDRLSVIFTNCGFIGIPLILGVFGTEGVFYLIGFLVCFNTLLWTFGYKQMSNKINIKKIITNPNIIAVTLGLIIYCLQIPITKCDMLFSAISSISTMNSPLAMILIGILFADFKFDTKYLRRIIKTCLLRIVGVSILSLCVIFAFYKIIPLIFVGFDLAQLKTMLLVTLICSMCPTATSVPSLSCLFEKDSKYSSLLVCITTLLCVISIPLFVVIAEKIIL